MKKILLMALILITTNAFAEKNYVVGIQKVTFRKGAGTDSKILKMMEADSPVTILEVGGEWTKVKDAEGNEGYILARFLTKKVPGKILYTWLKKKYDKLKEQKSELTSQQKLLKTELKSAQGLLTSTSEKLTVSNQSFETLKTSSADFLKLESNFKRMNILFERQSQKVEALEGKLSKHYMYWFLAGAGVLFFGWLLGVSFKKRRSEPQLSF